jgi:hypothetical protein
LDNLLYWDNGKPEYDEAREAITAIKQTRSAPTSADYAMGYAEGFNDGCKPVPVQEPVDGTQVSKVWWDGEKLMAKPIPLEDFYLPAPAVQEPVAWRNAALRVGEDLCSVGPFGYYDMTAEQWLDWALSVVTVHAPPAAQRQWVGLTPEEVEDIVEYCDGVGWDVAERIEAKLKEKNIV